MPGTANEDFFCIRPASAPPLDDHRAADKMMTVRHPTGEPQIRMGGRVV